MTMPMHRIAVPNRQLNGPFKPTTWPPGVTPGPDSAELWFADGVAYTADAALLAYFRATPMVQIWPAEPDADHLAAVEAMRTDPHEAERRRRKACRHLPPGSPAHRSKPGPTPAQFRSITT